MDPGKAERTEPGDKRIPDVLRGLGRGFGGALLFALPLFMTMEMWWLGFYIERSRLVLLLLLNLPLLALLSHHAGFERTKCWQDDVRDGVIAFGIGLITCGAILSVLGLLGANMTADEIVGKIAVQTVPASIGALLGSSQLGADSAQVEEHTETRTYLSQLFLMFIGALFLELNVAPTEEMVLISYKMTEWHAVALIVLSIIVMHGFTYALEFTGTAPMPDTGSRGAFFFFTVVGYAIAIGGSLYVLWTFGRTQDVSWTQIAIAASVLGFPASVGAAAARLIL
ncbi:TIGR02587 family membrane protein [Salinihabitans flavidus]|nr:TIGR02587 family membrane protein [Salinihabitans flavidus]